MINKQTLLYLAILFAWLMGTTACKKEESPAPIPTSPPVKYFTWLQPGNRWVYDFVVNNQVVDSLIREIVSVDTAQVYHAVLKDSHATLNEYYFRSGNWLMYYTGSQSPANATGINKTRLQKGDNWQQLVQNDTLQMRVEQTDTPITTNAGIFRCNVLEQKNLRTKAISRYYVNETSGMIQLEMGSGSTIYIYRLRHKNF